MSWQEEYKRKLISAEQAAKLVKSGDHILTALALGEPSFHITDAIVARRDELYDVYVMGAVPVRPHKWYQPEMADTFKVRSLFAGKALGHLYKQKIADFCPATATTAAELLYRRFVPVDVGLLMVTPPNKDGYVNFGLTNFYTRALIENAKLLIAEVNDQLPTVFGDNWAHVSEIDFFVEHSSPIPEVKRIEPTEAEKAAARNVLELIHDRDTIQMGIGAVPEEVVRGLTDRQDLGVLTEMFPIGLPSLIQKGIVTNKYKPVHRLKTVATFCMGDREMYDFIDHNPSCEFYPASYTNSLSLIAQHDNIVCINGAVEVDLKGQVCSESAGVRQISGTGGQFDFMMGAFWAKNGRGINVLPSTRTTSDGRVVSSIVPTLQEGATVTVHGYYAQYVITEYGIANLRGKSYRQRAEELIAIAHPDFRAELKKAAQKMLGN